MTPTEALIAIAAAIIGFLAGRTRRSMELHDANARARDFRLGLTYAGTLATDGGAFAMAFVHGHTDLITRHWPDFYAWRARELQREKDEGCDD
jgi:hypothetical protein